eukprot:Hpha_TRINITY_DN34707_c0_g1::TRINITY_DN34707_c0_g1_i1::g.178000::m.178000
MMEEEAMDMTWWIQLAGLPLLLLLLVGIAAALLWTTSADDDESPPLRTLLSVAYSATPGPLGRLESRGKADRQKFCSALRSGMRHEELWLRETDGSTALHICAEKGREDLAELLLQSHPRPVELLEASKAGGATALHVAAVRGAVEVAEVLLSFGANVKARTGTGKTPIAFTESAYNLESDMRGVLRDRLVRKRRVASILLKAED